MIELQDYQWELDGVVFGYGCPIEHEADSEPGSYGWRTQDQPNPSSDGTSMGRDYIDPDVWSFKLFTDCQSEAAALDALEEIGSVWRGDQYRSESGKVAALRYRLNHRTRVVYGRPRRFSAPLGPEFHSGRIMITSDFKRVSELYFDDDEESKDVKAVTTLSGGFRAPVRAPIRLGAAALSPGNAITVGGRQPTPMVVEFHNGWGDPFLEVDGVRVLQLKGTVPYDQPIIVDARPWMMSAYRPDGAGAGNYLSRRTKLASLTLKPGAHTLVAGGSDPSGTAFTRVRWRKAYPTV